MPKPHPIVTAQECSECGLPWGDHPENPSLRDCIALLKARPLVTTSPYYPAYPNYGTGWWQTPVWTAAADCGVTTNGLTPGQALSLVLDFTDEDDPPDMGVVAVA